MRTPLLLAAALALVGAVTSCKKENPDPDGLVPATQEGKGTGDFLLNGAAFGPRPTASCQACAAVSAHWGRVGYGHDDDMRISFYRYDNPNRDQTFSLFISNVLRPGTFILNAAVSPYVAPGGLGQFGEYELRTIPTHAPYLTGPQSQGQVIVTRFDTTAHIISGTFEAKLREYQGTDSISITKGRFDLRF